jgi:beta-galactosidase GanA
VAVINPNPAPYPRLNTETGAPVAPPAPAVPLLATRLERAPAPPRHASPPNRLTAGNGRYYLDGRPVILRAAELQYFRIPAEQWADSIDKLRAAGCNAIASYLPWAWHEPSPGEYDFTGESHPQRNVIRFLTLVREAGLVFFARPGPFIYAEYEGFGYPSWLASSIPQALSQRPNGKHAVAPHYQLFSLLHPDYLSEVERWYRAVAETLRPYLNDPVVTWQLDNETGMIYAIRLGDIDFNPDAVRRYREFLRARYPSARALSRRWGRRVKHFEQVTPPGVTCSHNEMADWQSFFEHWIATYLHRLRRMVRDLDVGLPLTVNEAAEYLSPQNPHLKSAAADFYGYDTYTKLTGADHTADFPFASSHHPLRFQQFSSEHKPLTCLELGTGWWDWRAKVATAATVQVMGAGLAHGLKGYNLYAAQDGRDPGGYAFQFGGLLDESGNPTERLDMVARFQTFIARYQEELTASHEVFDPIAFLDYQPYGRLTPETCFPLPVPGLVEPLSYYASFASLGFHALLQMAGYNVPFVDLERISADQLTEYRATILASLGYLGRDQYHKLEDYVRHGGNLVTYPEPVVRRSDGEPLNTGRLWPHQPRAKRWLGRLELILHLISNWMVPYYLGTRRKTAKISPGALHLSDLIEPALVGQTATLRGAVLEMMASEAIAEHPKGLARMPDTIGSATVQTAGSTVGSGTVRGELRLMEFPDGGEVLLRRGKASAGYRVRVGSGTSTLIGTIPGGAYVTSRYYTLSPEERLALRRFAVRLFSGLVPRHLVPDESLEVETVARLHPEGGCFLFVINRLGAQRGMIHFPRLTALGLSGSWRAEVLFSAFGSQATAGPEGLHLDLQPDDVLVLRLV